MTEPNLALVFNVLNHIGATANHKIQSFWTHWKNWQRQMSHDLGLLRRPVRHMRGDWPRTLRRMRRKVRNWRIARVVQNVASAASHLVGSTVVRIFFWYCTVSVIIWIAVLMYVSFYYAYMPTMSHVRPVFLHFNSQCENSVEKGLCSYPEANLSLSSSERTLMRGQRYRVLLDLEMPHSPVNERLGMFMVKVAFLSESGKVLASSERSGMLHYQSSLLQSLNTVFYSLPMVLGISEEKQNVQITLFENYVEDSFHPAVGAHVVVLAKKIEIYSAALRIEAHFVGLRYVMKNWPVTSACMAIIINFLIISSVFFFAYSAFSPEDSFDEGEQPARPEDWGDGSTEEQGTICDRRTVQGESETESLDTASRQPSPGMPNAADVRGHGQSDGGMIRWASFPSCRWDLSFQGQERSSELHSSRSLNKGSLHYHSNDHVGFQDLPLSSSLRIQNDSYYVLSYRGGRARRGRGQRYGHDGPENGIPVSRTGSERRSPVMKPTTLRSRFSRMKVPEDDGLTSGSSTECVHMRTTNRRRRVKAFTSRNSSDSDDTCAKHCPRSHECMECDGISLTAPLKSRVPDGAASSSSEHLRNWTPGTLSKDESGPERSPSRGLSDNGDNDATRSKRSVSKAKARFGLSIRKFWP
ncbi:uncharacterized protein LOC141889202 [Acropora palmata]|uniref:uncharacterized protein LOC141889202 n=1 Tax=Acropora palmata TaxID=6131 RepID=UPI003DA1A1D4